MSKPSAMARREKAGEAAKRQQKQLNLVGYQVENDDIVLTNGPYGGRRVRELFAQGPIERDYVIKNLWFRGDEKVVQIINSLVCK